MDYKNHEPSLPDKHVIMESSTRPSTRGSKDPITAIEDDLFLSDESLSDAGFEVGHPRNRLSHLYVTTNLVTAQNITLADVITEEFTKKDIAKRVARQEARSRFRENPYGRVDPRTAYKRKLAVEPVYTMVPFPEVANLCEMALALNQKCRGRPSTAEDAGIFDLGSML